MIEHAGLEMTWFGHATLQVASDETTVCFDPNRRVLPETGGSDSRSADDDARMELADVVCVSHGHHYDSAGIRAVADADATVVCFEGVDVHRIDRDVERLADLPFEIREVDAESDLAVDDVILRTTAAYNDPAGPHVREPGVPYHPKGRGCGYHVTVSGTSVYWPGATDVLEGHEHLDVDVFCPPIGGTTTMDRHEAADFAVALDPDLVVPVHYDPAEVDADSFAEEVRSRGVAVALDE